ncbi:DUF3016 domain-containing protein [Neiella marina]|uniref:DUF3016 domain-containing protein n=1 Tax=Neiella holothuriorum TaxID=2870530 RepID=A0ABS7EJV0_9GAMM|nr:DUF3016 domain-containing protein [Neiella holothuriorum]MBW8192143.1 DUF3016 domain-containing protein [Neiella holothuriorum]
MKLSTRIQSVCGALAIVMTTLVSGAASADEQSMENSVSHTTDKMQLQWHEWDNYRDINEGRHETATKFRTRVFAELGETIATNADKLPDGWILQMLVIDVDLAGDTSAQTAAGMRGLRVFKHGFNPAMSIKYAVLDEQQNVVIEGAEVLSNRNYMNGKGSFAFNRDKLAYDKEIIDSWFADELLPAVDAH